MTFETTSALVLLAVLVAVGVWSLRRPRPEEPRRRVGGAYGRMCAAQAAAAQAAKILGAERAEDWTPRTQGYAALPEEHSSWHITVKGIPVVFGVTTVEHLSGVSVGQDTDVVFGVLAEWKSPEGRSGHVFLVQLNDSADIDRFSTSVVTEVRKIGQKYPGRPGFPNSF